MSAAEPRPITSKLSYTQIAFNITSRSDTVRKPFFLVLAMIIAMLSILPVTAQAATPDLLSGAAVSPAAHDLYFAVRLDDAYLNELNGLVDLVAKALSDIGVPVDDIPRIQDFFVQQMDPSATPADVDAALAWLGDTLSISAQIGVNSSTETVVVYVQITDQQAALDALNEMGAQLRGVGTAGSYMIYESESADDIAVLLKDDTLIITNEDSTLIGGGDYPTLAADANFSAAMGKLPAASYNLALYITEELIQESQRNDGTQFLNGDIAIGGTLLDSKTLTLDIALTSIAPTSVIQTIDPTFGRYIPANTTAMIHSVDLSGQLEQVLALAASQNNSNARAELEQALLAAGLSLDDLLAWTTGDYAIFTGLNTTALTRSLADGNAEGVSSNLDFGVVIEAVEPELAQQFASKLSEILTMALGGNPDVNVVQTEINGTPVTRIELNIPAAGTTSVNLALGLAANDEVFVFGTFRVVEGILTGASGFDTNPMYAESTAYLLPNAVSVWYADGSTLVSGTTLLGLGTVGSMMGGMGRFGGAFDMNFDSQPRAQTIQNQDEAQQIIVIIERLSQLVRYGTVSMTVTADGAYVVRATLTLGE